MNRDKIPKIRVLVRKRPMSKKQIERGQKDVVQVSKGQTIIVREQKVKVDLTPFTDEYKFNFDGAYDQSSTNQQIYQTSIKPLVQCAFDGARVSCFAYGQTGSGKTFTMLGDGKQVMGLYILAACDIFDQVVKSDNIQVWVSFYEIYCGKLFDLLNNRNILVPRQDAKNRVNIVGLSQKKVQNVKNLINTIQFGTMSRVTAQNSTNSQSSRSHAILQISLKVGKKTHGKISFIDLAGSERAADHADQVQKQTRIDGAEINKSLLALKQCIRALDQGKNHTPFRGSKLTMVLKDSFTGYCKSVMIGNISPNSSSSQNTLNTLKYADRVKQLKKPPKDVNQPKDGDNLDELNRQLMLPRQLVNHKRYQSSQKNRYQNNKSSMTPKKNKNNQYQKENNSIVVPKATPQTTKSDSKSRKNSNDEQIFRLQKQKQNKFQNYIVQQKKKRANTAGLKQYPNIYNQRKQSQQFTDYASFQQLANKHQKAVTDILKQQQQLVKSHEGHVNLGLQYIKKQMHLLRTIDDPDSNMQEYVASLDCLIDKQIEQLMKIKSKVKDITKAYDKVDRIEKKYIEESNKIYEYQQDNLLQNEDNLFRN